MLQLIDCFQKQDYNIIFSSPASKNEKSFDLDSIGVKQKEIELNNSSFGIFIKKLDPVIVLFDRFMMEEQFGWRVAEQCPNAIRILDTEDLHCLRRGRAKAINDYAEFDDGYLFNDTAKREIASIYRCDLSLIISEFEMDLLINKFNIDEQQLFYLPFLYEEISIEQQQNLPEFEQREHFVTIGNLLHEPNYNSIRHLKNTIWPLIREQLPDTEMHVYGAYASQKVDRLNNQKEGFFIKGFASDVNEVMQRSKVCLVPLKFGAGLKGKIFDAMINGTPCITTSIGAEGIFGNLDPNGFIEDETQSFVNRAIELYNNKTEWIQMQKNGFKAIKERFNRLNFEGKFLEKINQLQRNLYLFREKNFFGSILVHHSMQSTKYMSKWIEEKNRKKS
ncbi:MAG: glycosyltransferase family 4 protein [Acidimicrobiia bacterium]|nr:glycosyltransferase family 4 protein [Acidimicrobiia bacterium]